MRQSGSMHTIASATAGFTARTYADLHIRRVMMETPTGKKKREEGVGEAQQ